ncbi:957_t:CDS:2 [Cetraspora pellucida]|uniref:957_t:CDS:1 n=1 Tax=Cetraspora pellucida TaxID=1433469 RepID=A0ACA9LD59_9GLOM|nr:957_t:CDS:2 [Cetraspora pellucida]
MNNKFINNNGVNLLNTSKKTKVESRIEELKKQEQEIIIELKLLIENKVNFALKFEPAKQTFYQLVFQKIENRIEYLKSQLRTVQEQLSRQERVFARMKIRKQGRIILEYKPQKFLNNHMATIELKFSGTFNKSDYLQEFSCGICQQYITEQDISKGNYPWAEGGLGPDESEFANYLEQKGYRPNSPSIKEILALQALVSAGMIPKDFAYWVIKQIKEFKHSRSSYEKLTHGQNALVEKLMPNKELKDRYISYGLCQECYQPNTGHDDWSYMMKTDTEFTLQCKETEANFNKSLKKYQVPPQEFCTSRCLSDLLKNLPCPQNNNSQEWQDFALLKLRIVSTKEFDDVNNNNDREELIGKKRLLSKLSNTSQNDNPQKKIRSFFKIKGKEEREKRTKPMEIDRPEQTTSTGITKELKQLNFSKNEGSPSPLI